MKETTPQVMAIGTFRYHRVTALITATMRPKTVETIQ